MEYIARAAANIKAIVVFAKENKDTKVRNERLQERKAALAAGKINQDLAGLVESRRPFTWENLCYTVPVPGGQRQLLKDVFGYVKPGTLTALMGASGKYFGRVSKSILTPPRCRKNHAVGRSRCTKNYRCHWR